MTCNHHVVEVEHAEGGAASPLDNWSLGHQLQLLLCRVHPMLTEYNMPLTDTFRTGFGSGERIPCLSKRCEVLHEHGAQRVAISFCCVAAPPNAVSNERADHTKHRT